jgi:hypothetical protein
MPAAALLASMTAASETRAATDPCKPIGRTEDGKLVYSMKCENLPTPPKPPVAAATSAVPPPAAAEEEDPGGRFGMHAPSFLKPTNDRRPAGVGPSIPR